MWLENIGTVIGLGTSLVALLGSVFFFKRARRAEVAAKELEVESKKIGTADQMIELVKKAHEEAVALSQKVAEESKRDNEKLRRTISKLERAIRGISVCAYRDQCPVTERMQSDEAAGERNH